MTIVFYKVVTGLSVVFRVIKPQSEKGLYGQFTLGLCPWGRRLPEQGIYGSPPFSESSVMKSGKGDFRGFFLYA